MMGIYNLYNRWQRVNGSGNPVNASDQADLVDTNQGLAQLSALKDVTNTGAGKIVAGTGALVTGALTIATGLTTINNAVVSPAAQPTGTGTASMQILVPTWVTGALTITAYSVSSVTGATAAATTSTGTFSYICYGV
jgi:hypothetical protein